MSASVEEPASVGRAEPPAPLARWVRADLAYALAVVLAYAIVTGIVIAVRHPTADRMMILAQQLFRGHLDSPTFAGTVDTVAMSGRYYLAVGPLQLVPYLPFVALPALQGYARFIASVVPGAAAAVLALPLARAYGARGSAAYWVAAFTAFGTLLFYVSVFGDLYYLAHAESFLALSVLLLEWAGRRRPVVLGVLLGLSFLARPTTILAAIPFGVALLWRERHLVRGLIAFGAPIAAACVVYGAFNWARFGSPLEGGYALSLLQSRELIARRAEGVFSLAHVPENIRLAFFERPVLRRSFPFLAPSSYGESMLLVSPGLLTCIRAGFGPPARVLWAAAGLVAIPVFLYYGGGYVQYGFRYSLDFTPFLVALTAMATGRRFGLLERSLFVFSGLSVAFGIAWHAGLF